MQRSRLPRRLRVPVTRRIRSVVVPLKLRVGVLAAIALVSALLASCGPDDVAVSTSAADTVPAPLTGHEIFAANCAACHGAEGEGQPEWHIANDDGTLPAPPLNGDGHTWHHADGLLYRIVSQGGAQFESPSDPSFKSAMPAFEDRLSHEEIIAVLTYIKSLWGNKVRMDFSIRESQELLSQRDPYPPQGP